MEYWVKNEPDSSRPQAGRAGEFGMPGRRQSKNWGS